MLGLINNLTKTPLSSFEGLLNQLNLNSQCVLGFAKKKVLTSYTGIAYKLVDSSTLNEQDFYFESDGSFNYSAVDSWVTGSPLIKQWGNQLKEANFAYQDATANMPVLDTVNEKITYSEDAYFVVDVYSEINITNPLVSIYTNFSNTTEDTNYVITKVDSTFTTIQYAIRHSNETNLILRGGTRATVSYINTGSYNKVIGAYDGTNAKLNNNGNENSGEYSTALIDRTLFYIGSFSGSSGFNGSIDTLLIFNTDEYSNYTNLVNGGI